MSGRRNTSSPKAARGFRRGLVPFPRLFALGAAAGATLIVSTLFGSTAASAYWTASGTGSTTAAVATLAPPTNVTVPGTSASNVAVNWTASAGTPAPTGYYVTRTTDTTSMLACGSSPAAPITGTGCTDSSVPEGTHRYVVTAIYRSWTAESAASGNVVVKNISTINFTVQPLASVTAGSVQSVTVELRTALGLKLMMAGVPVTIGIGNNPGGSTLTGPALTANTNLLGEATFSGLSITKAGTGYTLLATSPGYSGAVSSAFTVTAAAAVRLVATGPASGTTSATATIGPFSVERQDTYGNPVASGSTDVSLASTSTGTKVFAASAGGASVTKVTIQPGSASASFFYGDTKAGSYSVTGTATGLLQAATPVTVSASAAATIEFVQGPAGAASGQTLSPITVQVLDEFRNPLLTGANPVALTKLEQSGGSLRGTTSQNLAGGLATFSGLSITGKAGTYHLVASYGTLTVTSAAFNIT